ncbi:hypothetical protein Btru_048252 [Bulinus truncatus]|nr:hypothetical protein Btru_048252 [Bulinus truncatus]
MDATPAASASASERPTSGVERNSAITYKNAVKDAIHETFLEYVDVDIILNIFKKYNRRVLVQKELEFIKSKLKNEGNRNACEELLNRLVKYDEWFPCLLKCLRDKYVNLGHVADQLVELEAVVYSETVMEFGTVKRFKTEDQSQAGRGLFPVKSLGLKQKEKSQKNGSRAPSPSLAEKNRLEDQQSPTTIEQSMKSIVNKLTKTKQTDLSSKLDYLEHLLKLIRQQRDCLKIFDGVLTEPKLPEELRKLCTLDIPVTVNRSNKIIRRHKLRIKQKAFEIVVYLTSSTGFTFEQYMTTDFLQAIEQELSKDNIQTFIDEENDEELKKAPINIRRDTMLVLFAILKNKKVSRDRVLDESLTKNLLLKYLHDKDNVTKVLSVLVLFYKDNFISLCKDKQIDLEEILCSLLEFLKSFVKYDVHNCKSKMLAAVFLEGLCNLANVKQMKNMILRRPFLMSLHNVVRELNDPFINSSYVHLLTTLGIPVTEVKEIATNTDEISIEDHINMILEEEKMPEIYFTTENFSCFERYIEVISKGLLGLHNSPRIIKLLHCLLSLLNDHESEVRKFQQTLVSSKLADNLLHLSQRIGIEGEEANSNNTVNHLVLKICMKLTELSSLFCQVLATTETVSYLMQALNQTNTCTNYYDVTSERKLFLIVMFFNIISKSNNGDELLRFLARCTMSSDPLLEVVFKVLQFIHNPLSDLDHEDEISKLAQWLQEALGSVNNRCSNGLHANVILNCLAYLAKNDINKHKIKQKGIISSLHQYFHPQMESSVAVTCVVFLKAMNTPNTVSNAESQFSTPFTAMQEVQHRVEDQSILYPNEMYLESDFVKTTEKNKLQSLQNQVTKSETAQLIIPSDEKTKHKFLAGTKCLVQAVNDRESSDVDDLSFNAGDFLEVLEYTSEDWWLARHCRNKKEGYIPKLCVINDDKTSKKQDWWLPYDRNQSENMLKSSSAHGMFLVRKTSEKGIYKLSVVDEYESKKVVQHFTIVKTNDCEYFLERCFIFKSLIDLINYYKETDISHCVKLTVACPLKKCRDTVIPRRSFISTPKVNTSKIGRIWKVQAVRDLESSEKDMLSFQKGDFFDLFEHGQSASNMYTAIHFKTNKKGCIPIDCVINDDLAFKSLDWWFAVDRKISEQLLCSQDSCQGMFLVRPVSSDNYALSVRDKNQTNGVNHYIILRTENSGYFTEDVFFKSLIDLINYYKENCLGKDCYLTQPCLRTNYGNVLKNAHIELNKTLATGMFSTVWKGMLEKTEVAVKVMNSGGFMKNFLNEAKILQSLNHHRIVKLVAVTKDPVYIVLEFLAKENVIKLLQSERGEQLQIGDLIRMTSQIAEGMDYIQMKRIIHRDLRAENILVADDLSMKITDFGLACTLKPEEKFYLEKENFPFPKKWTALEAVSERKYSFKSDVWSFGVVMYEVITYGCEPYPDLIGDEIVQTIQQGQRMDKPKHGRYGPIDVPEKFFDLMSQCWETLPDNRPTFKKLCNLLEEHKHLLKE